MAERRPFLHVRDVSKTFMIGNERVDALHKVDLIVDKGEFVCLIGASGCGKSTLLRIVAGFEKPTSGDVRVYDAPITGPGSDRGMVFQDYALFPWLTVRDNIAFGPRQKGVKDARDTADRYVDMVGLAQFADRYPYQLSGGMKQRVAIARVLANEANILLMDEPFGALDALTREQLQDELLEIWARTKVTILFVTHSVEEATLLADRVVVMTAGPGRIESDNRVRLARPREVSAPDFNEARRALTERLTSHVRRRQLKTAA
jgi:NitT/TauT family transport system ATP-binding protein